LTGALPAEMFLLFQLQVLSLSGALTFVP
jgi:hypothetical protein